VQLVSGLALTRTGQLLGWHELPPPCEPSLSESCVRSMQAGSGLSPRIMKCNKMQHVKEEAPHHRKQQLASGRTLRPEH
jgi:hypothetical protein